MDCFGDTEELAIFETKAVSDLLSFKWKGRAGLVHKVGCTSHLTYLCAFSIFINKLYVYNSQATETRTMLCAV